jgi:hypothetical protein
MKKKKKVNRGFCVQTKSGHAFDPKAVKISNIDINDIAHALSNLCRYSGHCKKFYSVAEHSVLVSRIIRSLWPDDLDAIWAGLLHDATEAYVGDITTPLKVLLPKFMEIEDALAIDIGKKFKIKWTKRTADRVKIGDLTALSTEARLLFENVDRWDMIKNYEPMSHLLNKKFPLGPDAAKKLFLTEIAKVEKELK